MTKSLKLALWIFVAACVAGFYYNRYRIAPNIAEKNVVFLYGTQPMPLDTLQGEDVAFVFYASWCGPCMKEMKDLSGLHQEFADRGLRLVALTDDTPEKIEAVRRKLGVPFEMYPLQGTLHDYGIYTIPTAYVFNQNGELVFEQVDALDWTRRDFIEQLFSDLK